MLDKFTLPTPKATKAIWTDITQSLASYALSQLALKQQQPLLIIAPNSAIAAQVENELSFYLADENIDILHFPDWELLVYDRFSPHQDIISERLETLVRLPQTSSNIIITSINTVMHKLCPQSFIDQFAFSLKCGDRINLAKSEKQNNINLQMRLTTSGYIHVKQVSNHGEFAIRGSIIDIFPMGSELPFRIELFDDEVETIRTFDPDDQRTIEKITHIKLLPAKEFPMTEEGIETFRANWRETFTGNPLDCMTYVDVSDGKHVQGIEYYLPLFFEKMATLFDYLPSNTIITTVGNTAEMSENFYATAKHRYEQLGIDQYNPILAPEAILLESNRVYELINQYQNIRIKTATDSHIPDISINSRTSSPLEKLQQYAQKTDQKILFCADTTGRREVLLELFKTINLYPVVVESWQEYHQTQPQQAIIATSMTNGFHVADKNLVVIAENQIFGEHFVRQTRKRKHKTIDQDSVIKSLVELKIGDPVVHINEGVGRFRGLETITLDNLPQEFLCIEYAEKNKLYIPITSLHLISRYTGTDPENAPLHHLGSDAWKKTKRKAAEKIRDTAAELLKLYAERDAKPGFAFDDPKHELLKFSAEFPFEETPDQQKAIEQVTQDMLAKKSMDRLVCGDVGFGKTEVAMRAAFIAMMSGKQVAILIPTTLLATQHHENFINRFAAWPVKIKLLSRFISAKEQKQTIDDLASGTVDIVIGTHKLFNETIKFKNLGLLIVDEEHRFGVRQKEKIKKLRANVDILTLTATPIPRTLNMAMSGIRDISIIATPPAKRLAIKTFVKEFDLPLIRESILREIMRGGQAFILHNEVETIQSFTDKMRELIPEAKIGIGHGQMRERELEQVMSDFYHRKFNVLICTTIVENGIDIPTANTMIIDRADKFGLAQLHQLRGRVGRSHHQAYAYLLTPPHQSITKDAQKRLDAISSLEDLGAGFMLATHDLEIRGAGELLGDSQSGNIHAIGFSLYMELLDKAVKALKQGKKISSDFEQETQTEIELGIPALIPEEYMRDIFLRLDFYKRLSNCETQQALHELQTEMIDRFGLLSQPIKNLFAVNELRLQAHPLGIDKIDADKKSITITFNSNPNIEVDTLVKLINKNPTLYRMTGASSFKAYLVTETAEKRLEKITDILNKL